MLGDVRGKASLGFCKKKDLRSSNECSSAAKQPELLKSASSFCSKKRVMHLASLLKLSCSNLPDMPGSQKCLWHHDLTLTPLYKVLLKESPQKKAQVAVSHYHWLRSICLFFNPFSPYLSFPVTLLDELPGIFLRRAPVAQFDASAQTLGSHLGGFIFQGEGYLHLWDGCRFLDGSVGSWNINIQSI